MTTQMKLRGIFTAKVFDNGNLVREIHEENVITTLGLDAILQHIGGLANEFLQSLEAGTGTTPASASDTSLQASVFSTPIASASVVGNDLILDWIIGNGDANGNTLSEFALFTTGGVMFNRKVIAGIAKTSAIQIQGSWILRLT
jgi:hypothetical protein